VRVAIVTHPDKRGIAAIGIFFDLTLVVSGANPIPIDNCGLLVYFELSGETSPELVPSLLMLQAEPSEQAGFDRIRIIPVLLEALTKLAMEGKSFI